MTQRAELKRRQSQATINMSMVWAIVRVQRRFRARQALKAAAAAAEGWVRSEAEAATPQRRDRIQGVELQQLRQARKEQVILSQDLSSPDKRHEKGRFAGRTGRGPINYGQYELQLDMLGEEGDGASGCCATLRQLPIRVVRGMLHPYEPSRVAWDFLMLVVVMFSCILDPYQAAFLDTTPKWWNWLLDSFFWFDVVLSFSTAIELKSGIEVDFQHSSVIKHHLTRLNGFTVDLLACVPWDSVVRIFEPSELRVPGYRMLRMMRVFRLLRAPRLVTRLTTHRSWSIHSEYIEFLKFMVYVTIMAHDVACFFFLWPALFVNECSEADVGRLAAANLSALQLECTPLGSWRDVEGLQTADELEQYVWALYWSVTTITTIGFGDVTPSLQCELVYTIVVEVFGMAFFALLVDHVVRLRCDPLPSPHLRYVWSASYIVQCMVAESTAHGWLRGVVVCWCGHSDVLDDHQREQNERKNAVVQFMSEHRLSHAFRRRVLDFMHFQFTSSSRRSFDDADPRFNSLSPALVGEMRTLIFRPVLRNVKLFDAQSGVPLQFVDALAHEIQSCPYAPRDIIVPAGTYGNSLCIVLTGQVVISCNGERRRLILSEDRQPIFGISATLDERTFHRAQNEFMSWDAESISYPPTYSSPLPMANHTHTLSLFLSLSLTLSPLLCHHMRTACSSLERRCVWSGICLLRVHGHCTPLA